GARRTLGSSRYWPRPSWRTGCSKNRNGLRLGGRYVRLTVAEKREVIGLVEGSDLSARQTLQELGVNRATFYAWYRRYREDGEAGLAGKPSAARRELNHVTPDAHQHSGAAALLPPPHPSPAT